LVIRALDGIPMRLPRGWTNADGAVEDAGNTPADVIELVKAGLDVDRCRAYLSAHAPSFVGELDDAVRRARAEDE
jgi:hypothetical protein